MKRSFLDALGERVLVCDGAMGTMLYARGIFINRSFDALNLAQPDLVGEVHREYLRAGADVIESNTFGANRVKLAAFGLSDRLHEINVTGAQIARVQAAERVQAPTDAIGTVDHDDEAIGTGLSAAISSFLFFASGALIPVLPWVFGMSGAAAIVTATVLVGIALLLTGATVPASAQGGLAADVVGEDYHVEVSFNFWKPTPEPIVRRLNQEINKILREKEVQDIFASRGLTPGNEAVVGTPELFAAFIKSEIATVSRIARAAGIKPE